MAHSRFVSSTKRKGLTKTNFDCSDCDLIQQPYCLGFFNFAGRSAPTVMLNDPAQPGSEFEEVAGPSVGVCERIIALGPDGSPETIGDDEFQLWCVIDLCWLPIEHTSIPLNSA